MYVLCSDMYHEYGILYSYILLLYILLRSRYDTENTIIKDSERVRFKIYPNDATTCTYT